MREMTASEAARNFSAVLDAIENGEAANRQAAQRAFLADVLSVVPVIDYDRNVAEHHAALLAHTHAQGQRRGPRDLMIAATARATKRAILTTDTRARFDDLPDVTARIAARKRTIGPFGNHRGAAHAIPV